jgi:hypothetical protein
MNITAWLSCFASVAALVASLTAQAPTSITVNDPRPVASIAEKLEILSGHTITYEDPVWVAPSEVVDVTDSVRTDLQAMPEDMRRTAPRVLVPKGGRLSITISQPDEWNRSKLQNVMQQALLVNAAAKNRGAFQLAESDGRLHILPALGLASGSRSPLDATVSIVEGDRNGIQILEALCDEISRSTGTTVNLGVIPLNAFLQHHAIYGASNRNAREFLSLILDSVGPGYSWQLFFDPRDGVYGLNVHWVQKPE